MMQTFGTTAKNLICWEKIFYLQIANLSNPKTYFSSVAKHSLLLLICIFPSSQRKHFSSAEKNKFQKFSLSLWLGYFFPARDKEGKFSDKSEILKISCSSQSPADPFVRSVALQWVPDRQGAPTYQPLTTHTLINPKLSLNIDHLQTTQPTTRTRIKGVSVWERLRVEWVTG